MATITYTVTVSGGKFLVDSATAPKLTFRAGDTYEFAQSASSTSGPPLRLSATSDGTHNSGTEYTTGVTVAGTAGSSGGKTTLVASGSTTATLYYYSGGASGYGAEFSNSGYTTTSGGVLKPVVGAAAEKWGPMVNHAFEQLEQNAALPSQTGKADKVLKTSGSATSWTDELKNRKLVASTDGIKRADGTALLSEDGSNVATLKNLNLDNVQFGTGSIFTAHSVASNNTMVNRGSGFIEFTISNISTTGSFITITNSTGTRFTADSKCLCFLSFWGLTDSANYSYIYKNASVIHKGYGAWPPVTGHIILDEDDYIRINLSVALQNTADPYYLNVAAIKLS